jgi:hypothetical protein
LLLVEGTCAPHSRPSLVTIVRSAQAADSCSLTSLREKLIKIDAKVVSHGRYVTFQVVAEVAVSRQMFADILSLIAGLWAPPAPA